MTVAIIEDDRLLNQALDIALRKEGYSTLCIYTKEEAWHAVSDRADLLLIDIGLPDGDGISLYRELRQMWKVPAIFLTARDEEADMLAAFDEGAEDYVVKPFSMKVLLKRIETVLKRSSEDRKITYRDLTLYIDRKQVLVSGQPIVLTGREYQLLEYLMMNQGRVLTKENILENIWGLDGQFVVDNAVSVTINRLRKKIEPGSGKPEYIKNVFGLGYRMGE